MAISILNRGVAATLPASAPGEIASVEVTVGSLAVGDSVILTQSGTAAVGEQKDVFGGFGYNVVKASGKFTIYSDREQLTAAKTFDWVVFTGTA